MSASVYQGASRAPLRWLLALVAATEAVVLGVVLSHADRAASAGPAPLRWLAGGPLAAGAVATVVVLALAAFARRARPLTAGAIALAGLALLSEAHTAVSESPRRVFFTSGAMLLGWLAGLAYARVLGGGAGRDPARAEEILAEAGAAAALAATYVNAAVSKLGDGGLGWMADASTLRGLVIMGTYVDGPGPLQRAVAEHPGVASALALVAVLTQLGSPLYLLHRRLRMLWGTLLLGFHLNVLVLTGIFYIQATILIVAWSYPWHRLLRRRAPPAGEAAPAGGDPPILGASPAERRRLHLVSAAAALIAAALVTAAWTLPVARWLTWHRPSGDADGAAGARGDALARLGPIATGDALDGGFRVAAILRRPDHFMLRVSPPGAEGDEGAWVTLRLSPSPGGADRGPFGAGTADLLYDQGASTRLGGFLPAGRDIARRLRGAAGGADTGRLVAGWLASDLPGP